MHLEYHEREEDELFGYDQLVEDDFENDMSQDFELTKGEIK